MKKTSCVFLLTLVLFADNAIAQQKSASAGSRAEDSLEIAAFNQLTSFIATDSQKIELAEAEKNSISHAGEQHMLVPAIARGAAAEGPSSGSWDKFLPTVYHRDPTEGSPFLLFLYVPGLAVDKRYSIINKADYLYNYDKMSGNLVLKRNSEPPIAVNRNQVEMFCLKTDKGGLIFMHVHLLSDEEFFQVMYKGRKYSSYKLYKNILVKANQATNGYVTAGKNFDEYQDIVTYFIVDETKAQSYSFELKRKSLRKVADSIDPSAEQYFTAHKYDEVTEQFIAGLLASLDK